MATISDCLKRSVQLQTLSDSPRLDVELLLSECLGKDRAFLFTWPEHELSELQLNAFESALARRAKGEPIAHILGEREFWSLRLEVNNSTLIPRPETELLVEVALELLPDAPQKVLDLGTGTGAIALALASERQQWQVVATEKSTAAAELAERNRAALALDNVRVLISDWFSNIPQPNFDLIVSNPPYIDAADVHLEQGDVRFEPASALVAEEQGLADIRLLIEQCARLNSVPFWLVLEHGWQQGTAVRQLFSDNSYREIATRRDYGGNERLTLGFSPTARPQGDSHVK